MSKRLAEIFKLAQVINDYKGGSSGLPHLRYEVCRSSKGLYIEGTLYQLPELKDLITHPSACKNESAFHLLQDGTLEIYWVSHDYHNNDYDYHLCETTAVTEEQLEKLGLEKLFLEHIKFIVQKVMKAEEERKRKEAEEAKARLEMQYYLGKALNISLEEAGDIIERNK